MVRELFDARKMLAKIGDISQPIRSFEITVPESWTDFNGHMNEARYLESFGNASDTIMRFIGCDQNYIDAGKSFFTVETHICHIDEVHQGERIFATTQVLNSTGKKLHLIHLLYAENSDEKAARLLASGEQMLLHVDLKHRKTCNPAAEIVSNMENLNAAHRQLPVPQQVGRSVG